MWRGFFSPFLYPKAMKSPCLYQEFVDFGAEAGYGQDANMSPAESTRRSTQAIYALS